MKKLTTRAIPTIFFLFGLLLFMFGSLNLIRVLTQNPSIGAGEVVLLIIFSLFLLLGASFVSKNIHPRIKKHFQNGTPLARLISVMIGFLFVIFISSSV